MEQRLQVRVAEIVRLTDAVNCYELRAAGGGDLPPFTAGAHLDVHLPTGLIRSYSLTNPQGERHRYLIGVARDAMSRGGSNFIHDQVRAGDVLEICAPRNNFALAESAEHSILIAGGIGITPILCMIHRLEELGRPWQLHYAARSRRAAAFLDELSRSERVSFSFDDERQGGFLDLAAIVASAPPGTHFYCCGPAPMLAAFEAATTTLPGDQVHLEYFTARDVAATEGGFVVELARSGKTIEVRPGETILEAVQAAGINPPHSCCEGICATCETTVLEGIPDHRDSVLSDDERASNATMMICCSGSKSPRLVLDL
jgi:ferredoxin-NADP reductase